MDCSPWGCKESGTTERLTLGENLHLNLEILNHKVGLFIYFGFTSVGEEKEGKRMAPVQHKSDVTFLLSTSSPLQPGTSFPR